MANNQGRYQVTRDPGQRRMWWVPLLRNIALTAPYFHNGSVKDLDEAIRVMAKTRLNKQLNSEDVAALKAYLEGLNGEFPVQSCLGCPSGDKAQMPMAL